MSIQQPQQIRVPNLPTGPMVDKDGNPTAQEITFRQTLIRSLQNNFGNEGLVAPSQQNTTAPNNAIPIIEGNKVQNQATGIAQQTLVPGTIIYDNTNHRLLVAIMDPMTNITSFKTVTVT